MIVVAVVDVGSMRLGWYCRIVGEESTSVGEL